MSATAYRRSSRGLLMGLWGMLRQTEEAKNWRRSNEREGRIDEAQLRVASALEFLDNPNASGLLGDGRLADLSDARAANLLDSGGIFLGMMDGQGIYYSGDGHGLVYGRTRSGKGVCLVLPALAHIRDRSVLVSDLKDGELAYASAIHRADTLKQRIVFLNPWKLNGFGNTKVNPLARLVKLAGTPDELYTAARDIARILAPIPPKNDSSAWVGEGARRLLATRMMYLAVEKPTECTLASLWSFANQGGSSIGLDLQEMKNCVAEVLISGPAAHFAAIQDDAPKQWEAYLSEVVNAVEAYAPGTSLARATSDDEFDFATLKQSPSTVFLMTPSRLVGIATQWIALVTSHVIETIAEATGPVRTLFLLDEVAQLPPMSVLTKAMRLYAGRGIQLFLFCQGRFSLQERYPQEVVREIEDQVEIFQTWSVEDPSLLKDIETWSGKCSVAVRGVSRGGGEIEALSVGVAEHARPVLQVENIRQIARRTQLIKVPGFPLFVIERVPYFEVDPWRHQIRDVRDIANGTSNGQQ